MDNRNSTLRDSRRKSSERSRPSNDSSKPPQTSPPPTFLTSFPSFSPPDMTKTRRKVSTPLHSPSNEQTPTKADRNTNGSRSVSASDSDNQQQQPSTINRTYVALRRTILDTITSRQSSQNSPTYTKIFSNALDGAGDPLAGASDEHVQRIIDSSGGPVSTVKKYSADLAESNERVATERNGKIRMVEENRRLRTEMHEKDREIENLQRQLQVAKQLFSRFIHKTRQDLPDPPNLQIVDSPSGPYALEDASGTILATLTDDFIFPESTPVDTPESELTLEESLGNIVLPPRANDTIRPRRGTKSHRLPQRLASAIKTETVEMKSPVDMLNLPPALREAASPRGGLVDRLGFYITPDREKRHQEANQSKSDDNSENSSIHSAHKEDEDSLLSASELLCDAPTGPATKLVFRSESTSSMRVFIEVDKPNTTPSPTPQNVVSTAQASADITAPSAAAAKLSAFLNPNPSPTSAPVQESQALSSLLLKLNQAFDVQQRKRTAEWSAFYEQARSLIRKDQTDTSTPEQDVAGVAALCSASNLSPDVRLSLNGLIRRGVPVSFRREVWLERSGANNIRDPELYEELLTRPVIDDEKVSMREIDVDVERTLANNVFFREGVGKTRLKNVLIAFARHNPEIGYSQGLNIIAANLLLMVPNPEDGFALLTALVRDILPSEYYSRDGRISGGFLERDGQVTESYVTDILPSLHKHISSLSAPLTMFTPGWYISAFASTINGEALYRLWDLLFGFCDGRFSFCFAIALLKMNRKGLMACKDAEEVMSYLGSRMSSAAVSLDVLVNEAVKIGEKVSREDLKRRRAAVEKKLKKEGIMVDE